MSPPDAMQFRIQEMDCAEEVAALKSEIGPLVGGADQLTFDILNARMTVAGLGTLDRQQVVDAVARLGMRAEPWTDQAALGRNEAFWERSRYAILTAASGTGVALGFAAHALGAGSIRAAIGHEDAFLSNTSVFRLFCKSSG